MVNTHSGVALAAARGHLYLRVPIDIHTQYTRDAVVRRYVSEHRVLTETAMHDAFKLCMYGGSMQVVHELRHMHGLHQ